MKYQLEAVVQVADIPAPHQEVFKRRLGCTYGRVRWFSRNGTYMLREVQDAIGFLFAFVPDEVSRVYVHNHGVV